MKRNAKRILTLFLALVMIVSVFAACDGNANPTEPGDESASNEAVKLWFGYNTDNFMQDLEYEDEMEDRDYTLRLHGIREDVESVQLMITPSVNVVSYDLTMGDLTTEDGAVFSAENFEVFAEWYVENRFIKKGISKKRLRMELMKKGITKEIIDEVLEGRDDEVEIDKIIERKRDKSDDEKLISYLCRQGFSYQLAQSRVREYGKD